MNDIIMVQKYPAQGIQKIEFRFGPLDKDFNLAGIVVMPGLNLMVSDFHLMYQGDIESVYPDETPRYPNAPFFMFDVDDKRFLSIHLHSIPCSLHDNGFNQVKPPFTAKKNRHPLPLTIKRGMRINAFIEYPLHPVPLSEDNSFTVILVRDEENH